MLPVPSAYQPAAGEPVPSAAPPLASVMRLRLEAYPAAVEHAADPDDPSLTAEQRRAHDDAVRAGEAGYLDPDSGLFVLTAAHLAERGTCCGEGCRHCPF